jgi:hypothetical protein
LAGDSQGQRGRLQEWVVVIGGLNTAEKPVLSKQKSGRDAAV